MIRIKDKRDCSGCSACVASCPTRAISMKADEEGFCYPSVNIDKCVNCGECDKVCSFNKFEWDKDYRLLLRKCFAAMEKNEKIRYESASGGFYYIAAREILSRGGHVYGTAWREDFKSAE